MDGRLPIVSAGYFLRLRSNTGDLAFAASAAQFAWRGFLTMTVPEWFEYQNVSEPTQSRPLDIPNEACTFPANLFSRLLVTQRGCGPVSP